MNDIIPVLLYHSVADEPTRDRRFAVSPGAFEAHIDAIEASGRVAFQISELAPVLRERRPLSTRMVAVTFDDGCADTYDAVYSLLDRGMSSTIYIITGEVGASDRLSRSQVAELASVSQIEIGAHSVHHPYLDELRPRELLDEVERSKVELEDISQVPIDSFAYPHGAYDKRVRQAVIDGGYSSAVGVKNAISHAADDVFAIARWTVTAGTSASRIGQILEADNVPRAWARERIRTYAYRTVRRGRRRFTTMLEAHS